MKSETNVEDLLATIRKAIDQDIDQLDRAAPTKPRPVTASMRQMRVSMEEPEMADNVDIMKLRERVSRNKLETAMSMPSPVVAARPILNPTTRQSGMRGILSGNTSPLRHEPLMLRTTYADDDPYEQPQPEPQGFAEVPQAQPLPGPYYQQPPMALMSPEATYSAQNSFQALADNLMAQMGGDAGVDNMARDLLRPMLQRWLDENLPPLVERMVREEIERVARRGR